MAKAKVLEFPLLNYVHHLFEEQKAKMDDIKRRKAEFLFNEAYTHFLDLYLTRTLASKTVDLPPFYYTTGAALCQEAFYRAESVMLDVIRDNRINQCYTKRINELKKIGLIK